MTGASEGGRAWLREGLGDGQLDTWILRCGPPGDPPGPLRLSTPVGLAFTTGPPPVMAAPGERGRVQGRSGCAGAAGMRAAASRPGPVLVRAGAWLRPAQCGRRGPR